MSNVSFNPALTTQPQNSFLLKSGGYVQGAVMDDPSSRLWLTSGVIAASVTQPFWGGMAIEELVATVNENGLGNSIALAATTPTITGFSTFNQVGNFTIVPGNSAPFGVAAQTCNFFRLGSNARLAVQCSSGLAAAVEAGAINQQISWDFTNQQLIPYNATPGALPVKIISVNTNSKIISYNSGTGAVTWTVGAAAIIQL